MTTTDRNEGIVEELNEHEPKADDPAVCYWCEEPWPCPPHRAAQRITDLEGALAEVDTCLLKLEMVLGDGTDLGVIRHFVSKARAILNPTGTEPE